MLSYKYVFGDNEQHIQKNNQAHKEKGTMSNIQ